MKRTVWRTRRALFGFALMVGLGCGAGPEGGEPDAGVPVTGGALADAGTATDGGVPDAGLVTSDGGTSDGGASDAGEPLSYVQDVAPLFYACGGCHKYGTNALMLADPQFAVGQLVDAPSVACPDGRLRVKPGSADPKDSYLMAKLLNTDLCSGGVMPPSGALSAEQIATVTAWIEGGALP